MQAMILTQLPLPGSTRGCHCFKTPTHYGPKNKNTGKTRSVIFFQYPWNKKWFLPRRRLSLLAQSSTVLEHDSSKSYSRLRSQPKVLEMAFLALMLSKLVVSWQFLMFWLPKNQLVRSKKTSYEHRVFKSTSFSFLRFRTCEKKSKQNKNVSKANPRFRYPSMPVLLVLEESGD